MKREQKKINFVNIIQFILININENSDISDAIISLIKNPDYTHILKLIGMEKIYAEIKNINQTLGKNELIASETEINIRNILVLSKLKAISDENGIRIMITLPITRNGWNVYEIIHIPLKRGSEVTKVDSNYKFFVDGPNQTYALMTRNDLEKCRRYPKRFLCQFELIQGPTCEYEAFAKNNLTRCSFREDYMPQVKPINETYFYASVDRNTTLLWSCQGPEQSYYLQQPAWIIFGNNCMLRTQYEGPENDWMRFKMDIPTFRYDKAISTGMESNETEMVDDNVTISLLQMYHEINGTYRQATKPINRIFVNSSSIMLYVIIIFVLLYLFSKYIFC